MYDIDIVSLFKAKAHFGHLKRFVCPKMMKYIHHSANNVSIINLDITAKLFKQAMIFIESIINNNGVVLFVGTKKQAKKIIKIYSDKFGMPYVNNRWLGGTLTNYKTIKKSISKFLELEAFLNSENLSKFTKKEILSINRKVNKLRSNFDGIKKLDSLPDVLFVIDVNYENIAVKEANKLGIPVVGIVDTNSDPSNIDYVIPGNDDSVESINFYLNSLERIYSSSMNKKQ